MNEMNTPPLQTERLVLRRFTEEDIPAVFAIYSDEEANTYLPMFPLKTMEEAAEHYQRKYARLYSQPMGCAYAVCLKEGGGPIGYVHSDMEAPYDFSYGFMKAYWGRGYASEAARAAAVWLKQAGLPYITATHDVNNPGSGRVMRALGMDYKYSYKEQWQPKNFPVIFRMYQLNLNGFHDTYMGYWEKYPEHFIEAIN